MQKKHFKGRVRAWNDERGFGFIEPSGGGQDVFLHVSALRNRERRPAVGQSLTYVLTRDGQGRPRAGHAALPGDRLPRMRLVVSVLDAALIAGLFLAVVWYAVLGGRVPVAVPAAYLVLSAITFLAYALDKKAARAGAWRTPENTLHWMAIAGGWPGALVAQQALRHKSRKTSFRLLFWLTVLVNCSALAWIATPDGNAVVQTWIAAIGNLLQVEEIATVEWAE